MFFQVPPDIVKGKPIDEKLVSLLDPRGILMTIPVLDKQWPLIPLKTLYEKYPGTGGQDAHQALKKWRATTVNFRDELNLLTIEASYERFWCNVVNQSAAVLSSLRSFLTNGCRSYDCCEMDRGDLELHSQCASLVFLTTLQICCKQRLPTEHISRQCHSQVLQKIIKLPFLMDFSSFFGECSEQKGILTSVWSSCFENNRRLYTELRMQIRDIGDMIFQSLETKIAEDRESGSSLNRLPSKDIIAVNGYICDVACNLQRIIWVAPDDILDLIRNSKLHNRLAQFADKAVFQLNQEIYDRLAEPRGETGITLANLRLAKDRANITEFAIVDSFRRLVNSPNSNGKAPEFFQALLNAVQEFKQFALIYEKWAPIKQEILDAKAQGVHVEDATLDMLIFAIKESFQAKNLPWEYNSTDDTFSSNATGNAISKTAIQKYEELTSTVLTTDTKNESSSSSSSEADLVTNEIMEMLGGMSLERDYVKTCVLHYSCDLNTTVDAILSGSVPFDVSVKVAEPLEPKPQPEKQLLQSMTEKPAPPADPIGFRSTLDSNVIKKIYYGKRDTYEEIEDEGVPDETRLVTIARAEKMYEDEYDDTYDEFEEVGAVVRLNERKDPVIADIKAASSEESSEDTEDDGLQLSDVQPVQGSGVPAAQPRGRGFSRGPSRGRVFSTRGTGRSDSRQAEQETQHRAEMGRHDVWVKQMADNFSAQVNRRDQYRGGHSTSDTRGGRGNKEKQKARIGNHNRKDAGQWKRSQGML